MLIYPGVMMIDELAEVKHAEDRRYRYETMTLQHKQMRDIWIITAFEAGYRQKEIGSACGLSESTIKHIISAERKKRV